MLQKQSINYQNYTLKNRTCKSDKGFKGTVAVACISCDSYFATLPPHSPSRIIFFPPKSTFNKTGIFYRFLKLRRHFLDFISIMKVNFNAPPCFFLIISDTVFKFFIGFLKFISVFSPFNLPLFNFFFMASSPLPHPMKAQRKIYTPVLL